MKKLNTKDICQEEEINLKMIQTRRRFQSEEDTNPSKI